MRIVHVTHQFPEETHGGVETYVVELALAQQAAGHEVAIVSGSVHARPQVETSDDVVRGLPVRRIHRNDLFFDAWDGNDCPPAARLVVERARELEADVVHLHHWIRLSRDLVARLEDAGFPVVVTLHDLVTSCPRAFRMRPPEDAPCDRPLAVESCLECVPRRPWQDDGDIARELDMFLKCSRAEIMTARAVLCSTASIGALITDAIGVPRDRVEVLPLGHTPRFEAGGTARTDDGVFRFAYWGSITHRKGVDLLIEAFRSVYAARGEDAPELELHVFGRVDLPDLEERLRARSEGFPVTLHGRFEWDELAAAGIDCAVFPSRCIETYGIVLDEAFELGVPVVVSDLGAFAERAGDGGLAFDPNDAGDLARKMGAVAFDPATRERLAAGRPAEPLTPDEHLERLLAVYRRAVESPPRDDAPKISESDAAAYAWERSRRQFEDLIRRAGPGSG